MRALKIALTGGIACGKSQLAKIFVEFGVNVIRLDDISKEVTTAKSTGLRALVNAFGEKILDQNGNLDRQILREILLSSKNNQNLIEEILHPKILTMMQIRQEQAKEKLTVVEIPLLVEKKLEYLFDRIIVVSCSYENQLERLKYRANVDETLAKKMIATQISQNERLKIVKQLSSDIIENNGKLSDLRQQATQLHQKLITL